MERFIFDLQRFDSFYISDEGKITIDTEGFEYDGTFDVEGNNLLNITTSKTEGGKITVRGDYYFTLDGNNVQIKGVNTEDAGEIVFTYGSEGNLQLDASALTAAEDSTIEIIASGGATKLILPTAEDESSIKIGKVTYNYTSGGNAYFNLENDTVKGFVPVDVGDSITVSKTQAINIYDEDYPDTSMAEISGNNYTVSKNRNNYTLAITESSVVTIGDTTLDFTVSKATRDNLVAEVPIFIIFEDDGSIVNINGLYNLTDANDKLIVNGADVANEYGGLPVYDSEGILDYISISDGDFTLTGGTAGNQKIAVNFGATVYNVYSDATIDDDAIPKLIENSTSNTLITGSNGNDTIRNSGMYTDYMGVNVTISAKDGDDFLSNSGASSVSIDGGADNDSIHNSGYYDEELEKFLGDFVTLNGGDGDDYIYNIGSKGSMIGGAGNDTIYNAGDYEGYLEYFVGDSSTIDGGAGNDRIYNNGSSNVLINAGAGNDRIYNNTEPYDDVSVGNNVTINAGDGNDYVENNGSNVSINAGNGNDSIYNYGKYGDYEDISTGDEATIIGGKGHDYIHNTAANVSINGGAGNDSIKNWGNYVTINGGDGNDSIFSNGSNSSISGGAGNDSIFNGNNYVTVSAGDGDDYINYLEGSNVTINAGAGNDSIILYSAKEDHLIEYNLGDGNDTIYGFNEASTLQIGDGTGTYSKATVDYDIIFTVGEGKITFHEAANFSPANILGEEVELARWTLDGTRAIYGTSSETLITVEGIKSLDGISLDGNVVTISKAALGTDEVTISDGYTLALGSDVTAPKTTNAWSLSGTTATYKQTTTAGYTLANNAITYSKKATSTLATVKGVKSVDGLSLNGTTVTVSKAALGTDEVTIGNGYTLKLGSDVDKPVTTKAWKLSGTSAAYNQTTSAGYTLADNAITYSKKATETLVTVSGVKSVDGLSVSKKVVTVSKASVNAANITISGDGYTLKLGSDVTKSSTTKAWSLSNTTANYKQTTTAGYTLASNAITYNQKATSTLTTVKGVTSLDGISLSKKVVTVSKASLGTDKVTISGDGYTLKLGSDVTKSSTTKAWSLSNTTANYKQTTTAGYTLASNAITYNQKATSTLTTVKGVTSLDGISLSKKVVTVSKASLGTSKVTISGDGYTLKLGSNVSKPTTQKAAWSLKSSTVTYKSSYKTEGYTLASDSKSIAYSAATTAAILATVKGATSTDGLSVSGNKVTLKNSALSSKVTVGGSYEFNFASDYKNSTITGSSSADTITVGGAKVSINGGKGNDTIKLTGKNSTLLGSAGNDTLTGSSGADTLNGGAGNDIIFGSSGNDSLFGDKGNDSLSGGAGNDSLWGGAGNDTLIGGAGKDVFIFRPGEGTDTITDYASGDMLKILNSNGSDGKYTKAAFASGKLTLTIDGGGSVVFSGVKSGDTFNINGTTRTISGKTLK